jgi:hypothetical protein
VRAYYAGGRWYGYSGWDDYQARNNAIGCKPGTMTKLDDGQMYALPVSIREMKRGGSKAASERVVRPRSPSTHKSDFGRYCCKSLFGVMNEIFQDR